MPEMHKKYGKGKTTRAYTTAYNGMVGAKGPMLSGEQGTGGGQKGKDPISSHSAVFGHQEGKHYPDGSRGVQ